MCTSKKAFQKQLDMDVKAGFHPKGTNSIKGVVDHESAHFLDFRYRVYEDEDLQDMYYNDPSVFYDISTYARKNVHEMIADGFSEYRNNKDSCIKSRVIANTVHRKREEAMR